MSTFYHDHDMLVRTNLLIDVQIKIDQTIFNVITITTEDQ